MEDLHKERLKTVAKAAIPIALGSVAVKNIREIKHLKHVSYWEASQTFIVDLIEDGREAIRLSGTVLHGPAGREDIADVELYEGFNYTEGQVEKLEQAFPAPDETPN